MLAHVAMTAAVVGWWHAVVDDGWGLLMQEVLHG